MEKRHELTFEDFRNFIDSISGGKIEVEEGGSVNSLNKHRIVLYPKGKERLFGECAAMEEILNRLNITDPKKQDSAGIEPEDVSSLKATVRRNRRLERENLELRSNNRQLAERDARLTSDFKNQKTRLEEMTELYKRLSTENSELRIRYSELGFTVNRLKAEVEAAKKYTPSHDHSDPEGYYKALGIDSELTRDLTEDTFEKLLTSLYRAYSRVYHPDLGGDVESMRRLNNAYEFLINPLNRRSYGR